MENNFNLNLAQCFESNKVKIHKLPDISFFSRRFFISGFSIMSCFLTLFQ